MRNLCTIDQRCRWIGRGTKNIWTLFLNLGTKGSGPTKHLSKYLDIKIVWNEEQWFEVPLQKKNYPRCIRGGKYDWHEVITICQVRTIKWENKEQHQNSLTFFKAQTDGYRWSRSAAQNSRKFRVFKVVVKNIIRQREQEAKWARSTNWEKTLRIEIQERFGKVDKFSKVQSRISAFLYHLIYMNCSIHYYKRESYGIEMGTQKT